MYVTKSIVCDKAKALGLRVSVELRETRPGRQPLSWFTISDGAETLAGPLRGPRALCWLEGYEAANRNAIDLDEVGSLETVAAPRLSEQARRDIENVQEVIRIADTSVR